MTVIRRVSVVRRVVVCSLPVALSAPVPAAPPLPAAFPAAFPAPLLPAAGAAVAAAALNALVSGTVSVSVGSGQPGQSFSTVVIGIVGVSRAVDPGRVQPQCVVIRERVFRHVTVVDGLGVHMSV